MDATKNVAPGPVTLRVRKKCSNRERGYSEIYMLARRLLEVLDRDKLPNSTRKSLEKDAFGRPRGPI